MRFEWITIGGKNKVDLLMWDLYQELYGCMKRGGVSVFVCVCVCICMSVCV